MDLKSLGFREIDDGPSDVMSNLDHSVEPWAEEKLKVGKVYGRHAAWDFNALVWYDGESGKFRSQVWCYGSPVAEHEADSLEDLMTVNNENHGSD